MRGRQALMAGISLTGWLAAQINAPPAMQHLLRAATRQEAAMVRLRDEYTYRQDFQFEELSDLQHRRGGMYASHTEVTLTPDGKRFERAAAATSNALVFLRLSDDDFRDLRDVVPFALTPDQLQVYDCRYQGRDMLQLRDAAGRPGERLAVETFSVSPRQIYTGQRYFEGRIWIDPITAGVVRISGRAVPDIRDRHHGVEVDNLFGRFTTDRVRVDGRYWFPAYTEGKDWLDFSNGAVQVKETVRFRDYQRFRVQSTIRMVPVKP